jgi:hypothetical protein
MGASKSSSLFDHRRSHGPGMRTIHCGLEGFFAIATMLHSGFRSILRSSTESSTIMAYWAFSNENKTSGSTLVFT